MYLKFCFLLVDLILRVDTYLPTHPPTHLPTYLPTYLPIVSTYLPTYPPMKMEQSVLKCWPVKFRSLRFTQKKAHNIQNTAKIWNQE
jgi:hypothetical protein